MHARPTDLRFDLDQAILQLTQARTHSRELRANIGTAALRRNSVPRHTPCDPLRNNFRLIFHRHNRSIRSTTPTIAESIAAPASPVAAVDAPQPSCTISTVSPTPASTESSAMTE